MPVGGELPERLRRSAQEAREPAQALDAENREMNFGSTEVTEDPGCKA